MFEVKELGLIFPGQIEDDQNSTIVQDDQHSAIAQDDQSSAIDAKASFARQRVSFQEDLRFPQEEDLGEIKARTMYRMVEDIHDQCKLLFLTEKQASLLTESSDSISRILDAFEITKPKLIIRFLQSYGSLGWCSSAHDDDVDESEGWHPAWFTFPWPSLAEGCLAEQRLETFMSEVVIPVAVETNAIILCDALRNNCMLTEALCNVLSLVQARWAGEKVPFTLIGLTCEMSSIYCNNDPNACWRSVCRKSASWRARDAVLRTAANMQDINERGKDLNPLISNLVIGDDLDERTGKMGDGTRFAVFAAHMTTHLTMKLPGLCFKTGMGTHLVGDNTSTLAALQVVESGVPLVLLDIRNRPELFTSSREELILSAWAAYDMSCNDLMDAGTRDSLDIASLGYFHEILFDGNHSTKTAQPLNETEIVPLFVAIEECKGDVKASNVFSEFAPATKSQVHGLLSKFADRLYSDAKAQLTGKDDFLPHELGAPSVDELFYLGAAKHEYLRQITHLFMHKNLHSLNVLTIDSAKRFIGELTRLDRVPKRDNLAGLLLLQDAWDEYDVTMHLANCYKKLSKIMYFLVLLVGIFTVLGAVLREEAKIEQVCKSGAAGDALCIETGFGITPNGFSQILFVLALLSGVLSSTTVLLNPAQRWRQLRGSACSLQSTIFLYRARVGPFAPSRVNPNAAQQAFSKFLQQWRDEVVSGTDLQGSAMQRIHRVKIFKHMQRKDVPLQQGPDDFHSPLRPHAYINLRLLTAMKFFQGRIPMAANLRLYLQIALVILAASSAVLTQVDGRPASYVALVASISGGITSWLEFVDLGRKVERYTATIRQIKNLLTWWTMLDGVEHASVTNVEYLVNSAESILSSEFRAWCSTGGTLDTQGAGAGGKDGVDKDAGEGDNLQIQKLGQG